MMSTATLEKVSQLDQLKKFTKVVADTGDAQLQDKGVKVFGVSLDPVEAQKAFEQKDHLPFELLSDSDRRVTSAFGVPLMKNGLAARQAYLFKDGKFIWLDTKAATDKQAQDVLAVLASR